MGKFEKPLATINLPKSPTFLGNFCKGVKIYHFWATFVDIRQFFSGHSGYLGQSFLLTGEAERESEWQEVILNLLLLHELGQATRDVIEKLVAGAKKDGVVLEEVFF